jgi:hypothetical protein
MTASDEWPTYKMARDLAGGKVFPVSEYVILQTAHKAGIGRKMGRCIVFSVDDVQRLYEALPVPSDSCIAPSHQTRASPSADADLKKALELLRKPSRKKLRARRRLTE